MPYGELMNFEFGNFDTASDPKIKSVVIVVVVVLVIVSYACKPKNKLYVHRSSVTVWHRLAKT